MNEIVAIEEHYAHPEVAKAFNGLEATKSPVLQKRLEDLAETRIRDMDAAGITMQVLSHTAPAVQKVDADTSVRLAQLANDALHRYVRANSKRFAAFATIPTPSPKAAADELERTVTKLGFKGAMVHGLTNGLFLDNKMFWPIFERAQALDVPIYVHPSLPHQAVIDTYYKDYTKDWPVFMRAAWGFHRRVGNPSNQVGSKRRARRISSYPNHFGASWGGDPVLSLAHQPFIVA